MAGCASARLAGTVAVTSRSKPNEAARGVGMPLTIGSVMIPDGSVMLYDGSCGFCARTVQFVLDRERKRRTLCFAPLDGAFATTCRAAHPELRDVDSIVLVTRTLDGRE